MLLATRWIIAKLRNRKFFTLAELNDAIRDCVADLNDRVSRHLGASRRALFEDMERSALKPLPAEPFEYAEWKQCRAGLDYHVEIDKHYYSVPHALLSEKLWARITARTIELFHNGRRVAAHVRSSSNRQHTTVAEHMPSSHRRYADWTPESLKRKAGEIGPRPRRWSRSSCASARIPSRASARASASSGSPGATGPSGSRRACAARSRSARAPTPRSSRSWRPSEIADGPNPPRTGRR